MTFYMNPFDFVPFFGKQPERKDSAEWEDKEYGRHVSGRIRLTLGVVTPLHVTGTIRTEGVRIAERRFYRRKVKPDQPGTWPELPIVPASGIKGAVRAYLEALTNGVAASVHPAYPKDSNLGDPQNRKGNNRHVGVWLGREKETIDDEPCEGRIDVKGENFGARDPGPIQGRKRFEVRGSLPEGFTPTLGIEPMDVTSYLFGSPASPLTYIQPNGDRVKRPDDQGWRGHVRFEDCVFDERHLTVPADHPIMLDVNDRSSFGHPNLRANMAWYFTPGEVRKRNVKRRDVDGNQVGELETIEVIGDRLRGRKFYFHQWPANAINVYRARPGSKLVPYPVECVRPGAESREFLIHFRDIPDSLLKLFLAALCPSRGVRHKLGGLRPFGFGTVEFRVAAVEVEARGAARLSLDPAQVFKPDDGLTRYANEGGRRGVIVPPGTVPREERDDLKKLVHAEAWQWLRFILACPDDAGLKAATRVFAYPPYDKTDGLGFSVPVQWRDVRDLMRDAASVTLPAVMGKVLTAIHTGNLVRGSHRAPIEFDLYQRNASGFTAQVAVAGLRMGWNHRHPGSVLP